ASYVDVDARNRVLAQYTDAMRRVAARRGVPFVDLYAPTLKAMTSASQPLTINGIHVNDTGDGVVADLLMEGLGFGPPAVRVLSAPQQEQFDFLRETIREKNQQFFYRSRPVNAEYIVGRRVEPFGSVNFPPEMKQLDGIVAEKDRAIWNQAHAIRD